MRVVAHDHRVTDTPGEYGWRHSRIGERSQLPAVAVSGAAGDLGGVGVDVALPAFLRVGEAAQILRISRSAAYELANAWLATDGQTGLPVVRLGRSMRVPRAAIERFLAVGSEGAFNG